MPSWKQLPPSALLLIGMAATASPAAGQSGSAHAERATPSVRAVPLTGPVQVDGRLDEPAWRGESLARDFTQQDPKEGEPATQRTEVRLAFDDQALYIGARMYDSLGAKGVIGRLVRRDFQSEAGSGDNLMFVLDTYHDHVGRTIFSINPAGAKFDAGQGSSYADPSWDPVWEVATQVDSLGWTAEIRIPFSQLRFPRDPAQVWGMQIWRYVDRLNEMSMWSPWRKTEPGGPPRFGHIEGLTIAEQPRGVEILPYLVARASYVEPAQAGSPFEDGQEMAWRAGGDVKALLTSTLTLDATINPDFGQVEVDPAVVNLSAFETFFPEKRPFFVEGSGLFGFGGFSCFVCSNVQSMSLFYSRRIGRRPQGFVSGPVRFARSPENTTILGAAKVTGRTARGFQIGLLNAVTSREDANILGVDDRELGQEVEPFTNYLVGRLRRTFRNGNATVGLMGTSVLRRFERAELEDLLPARAEAVGVDWRLAWRQQRYSFMGNFAVSEVGGDADAVLRLQRSSARYFDRPDREHGGNGLFSDRLDPTLESLRGYGGYMRVAKDGGDFLYETSVNYRSPGFEVNDLAFLTRADYFWANANLYRGWTKPTRWYRRVDAALGTQYQWNYDGDLTDQQFHAYFSTQAPNYWNFGTFMMYRPEADEDRLTRGGPVVRRASSWNGFANLGTDSRKRLVVFTNVGGGENAEGIGGYNVGFNVQYRPLPNVSVSLGPGYGRSGSSAQFVRRFTDASATHFSGQRIVFADLVQRTLSMDTRLSATFTPTLSLELFAQPFVSAGEYSSFKEFVGPRTVRKTVYDDRQLQAVRSNTGRDSVYVLDPDRNPATQNFSFSNPDFNFRSLRGNAVLRWEYRPGSTLYLVWQQQRSGAAPFGDFSFSRDAGAIFDQDPDDVFLVKLSYWFGR